MRKSDSFKSFIVTFVIGLSVVGCLLANGCAVGKKKSAASTSESPTTTAVPSFQSDEFSELQPGARAIMSSTYTLRTAETGATIAAPVGIPLAKEKLSYQPEVAQDPTETETAIAVDTQNSDHSKESADQYTKEDGQVEKLAQARLGGIEWPVVTGGDEPAPAGAATDSEAKESSFPATKAEVDEAFDKFNKLKSEAAENAQTAQAAADSESATKGVKASTSDSIEKVDQELARGMLRSQSPIITAEDVKQAVSKPLSKDKSLPFWMIATIVIVLGFGLFGVLYVILNIEKSIK